VIVAIVTIFPKEGSVTLSDGRSPGDGMEAEAKWPRFPRGRGSGSIQTRRRKAVATIGIVVMSQVGCVSSGNITGQMTPSCWRGNPWGPEAEAARRCGQLPTIPESPPMNAWSGWARANLRDGDLVFRMGDARLASGLYPFSRITAEMAGSRYSHSGIIAWEGGEPVVYDTYRTGPRKQPFAIWVLDATGGIAFKRPKPEYQHHVAQALAFCREVYQKQVPFDRALALGNDRLYCIEMTAQAYESAGLTLAHPIRIDHLPRYRDFPKAVAAARCFSSLRPDQLAFVIGNETVGLWSSPALELVYEAPDARLPYTPTAESGRASMVPAATNAAPIASEQRPH